MKTGEWTWRERTKMSSQALRLLRVHDCGGPKGADKLARENCGACTLNVAVEAGRVTKAPDYAGWARVFVQATIPIDRELLAAELRRTDNLAYVDALRRDLATWSQGELSAAEFKQFWAMHSALSVIVKDPKISKWLSEHDPMALKQAQDALK